MNLLKLRTKLGINGEEVLTEEGVGDVRVSLFTMLTRGLSDSYIASQIVLAPEAVLEDLLVMAFQTRDVRGGKGERDLFLRMIVTLWQRIPKKVEAVLSLVPEYGCWRDLLDLYEHLEAARPTISNILLTQWLKDSTASEDQSVSLLAKWLPREGSKTYPGLAKKFADILYPYMAPKDRMRAYRKGLSRVNSQLKTAEVAMCNGTWASLEPTAIPGRCLHLKKGALLNQTLQKVRGAKKRPVTSVERFATEDRRACATKMKAVLEQVKEGKAKLKGAAVVQPHELVREVLQGQDQYLLRRSDSDTDSDKDGDEKGVGNRDIVQGQWNSIREEIQAKGGFGKVVPMCDFSGSMSGTPLYVSLALGILISETNHVAFRDHILTFDSNPVWHSFTGLNSLQDKVMRVWNQCGQGLSTNFYKACMLVLERMVAANLPVGEEPSDLLVLTDMGWDAASKEGCKQEGGWKSQIQKIRDAFAAAGGWRVPRIVIWNLQAEYKDFHAAAEDDGVVMVSGWSPNVLSALQTADGLPTRSPLEAVLATLSSARYDRVRDILRELGKPSSV